MTQEEKELVIKDLCERLPYGVMCKRGERARKVVYVKPYQLYAIALDNGEYISQEYTVEDIKPYLRPMEDMTEEECDMVEAILGDENIFDFMRNGDIILKEGKFTQVMLSRLYDYFNSIHVDYRGLIPKGLALEAKEGMYKKESDLVADNTTQITVGCKIRSKTNTDEILRIVSDDCHGDKFECSNGSVLSLRQINKYYDLYIEENKGTIIIN